MHNPKSKICSVRGCGRPLRSNGFCEGHFKTNGKEISMSKEQQENIRSNCCAAICFSGDRHEYGRQYCKKCGQACCWVPVKA